MVKIQKIHTNLPYCYHHLMLPECLFAHKQGRRKYNVLMGSSILKCCTDSTDGLCLFVDAVVKILCKCDFRILSNEIEKVQRITFYMQFCLYN